MIGFEEMTHVCECVPLVSVLITFPLSWSLSHSFPSTHSLSRSIFKTPTSFTHTECFGQKVTPVLCYFWFQKGLAGWHQGQRVETFHTVRIGRSCESIQKCLHRGRVGRRHSYGWCSFCFCFPMLFFSSIFRSLFQTHLEVLAWMQEKQNQINTKQQKTTEEKTH